MTDALEPVAWTGSGSLASIAGGGEGFIWGAPAKSHPLPLYGPNAAARVEELEARIAALSGLEKEGKGASRDHDPIAGFALEELVADLERHADAVCELKVSAVFVKDAHRLMGKEAAYRHAAELAREALVLSRAKPATSERSRDEPLPPPPVIGETPHD